MRRFAVITVLSLLTASPLAHAAASFTYLPISVPDPSCNGASTTAMLGSPDGSLVTGLWYQFNAWDCSKAEGVVWSGASGWTRSPGVGGEISDLFGDTNSRYLGFSVDNTLAYESSYDCFSCTADEGDPLCSDPGDTAITALAPGGTAPVSVLPDLTCPQDLCPYDVNVDGRAISRDGTTVVGGSACGAFRWTEATGTVAISPPGQTTPVATSVSDDGAVVVGYVTTPSRVPFVWSSSGGFQIVPIALRQDTALKISGDGSTLIGTALTPNGTEAFVWTALHGITLLGDVAGGPFDSRATEVSGDGSLVAGTGRSALGSEAFAWTRGGGLSGFGAISSVTDMTPGGLVLVGNTVWNPATGWARSLESMLAADGIPIPDQLAAIGISDDGRTLAGNALDFNVGIDEPFVATIDEPGLACEVAMNQPSYQDGDSVVITSLRFTNNNQTPTGARLRLQLTLPFGITVDVLDLGAGGGFVVPASFDRELGPVAMFTLQPGQPRGDFLWHCALEDPTSGAIFAEDVAAFAFE